MQQHILFLLDNPFTNDRRVYREAVSLIHAGYEVTLIAVQKKGLKEEEMIEGIRVIRLFDARIFDIKKRSIKSEMADKILELIPNIRIIHAHDHTMLAIGARIKKRKPSSILIYDSHELFSSWPLNVTNSISLAISIKSYIVRKLQVIKERKNAKYVDHIITVNTSIADYLQKYFKRKEKPLVVRNIPELSTVETKSTRLRDIFGLTQDTKILVFIGANIYAKTLNLEQIIDEFKNKPNVALIFICGLNQNAVPIQQLVEKESISNVFFHDVVPPSEIPSYLSSADVGLVPTWNKKDLSYWFALDNKLFEYMNAGIPILATQQPEYVEIVEKNHCGICVNPDQKGAYWDGFEGIMKQHDFYMLNVKQTAKVLNWESESSLFLNFYASLSKK